MWKEPTVAQFEVLSWHLPGNTTEILRQESIHPGRNSNRSSPEYKSEQFRLEYRLVVRNEMVMNSNSART
jgi:hypothetical protein